MASSPAAPAAAALPGWLTEGVSLLTLAARFVPNAGVQTGAAIATEVEPLLVAAWPEIVKLEPILVSAFKVVGAHLKLGSSMDEAVAKTQAHIATGMPGQFPGDDPRQAPTG